MHYDPRVVLRTPWASFSKPSRTPTEYMRMYEIISATSLAGQVVWNTLKDKLGGKS